MSLHKLRLEWNYMDEAEIGYATKLAIALNPGTLQVQLMEKYRRVFHVS